MDLAGRTVTLYGRFSPRARDRLAGEIVRRGGRVLRDFTRGSHSLVVGAQATTLIDNGALPQRLRAARDREADIFGERGFEAELKDEPAEPTTLPLSSALAQARLERDDADLLAAFDLVRIAGGHCRFADAAVFRSAGELIAQGHARSGVVRALAALRDTAPRGRHKVVFTPAGEPALEWADGHRTTLGGQGYLALDDADHPTLEDLFEAAALAEAEGDLDAAARLYDQGARADRSDAIAPYNLGNTRAAEGDHEAAILAYRRSLARDPKFAEARYNLAQALEAVGKTDEASGELTRLLAVDPSHADAIFNLAQLTMQAGDLAAAKGLYERYLKLGPPEEWAAMARKALVICAAAGVAGRS